MAQQTNRRSSPGRPSAAPARRSPSPWKWFGFLIPLVIVVGVVIAGTIQGEPGTELDAESAPSFVLPATNGTTISLDDVLQEGDTLLYFSMGVGCDGCFAQIPEAIDGLRAAGVNLVSIMVDPIDRVASEAQRFGITEPILIDSDRAVSSEYGMLGVYGHTDRPSHSFALVSGDGTVAWVKHYATMFVPLEQLLADMAAA